MVHRLLVQYGRPTDPEEFDRHYRDVHVGVVQAVPGLVRFTVGHPRSLDRDTPAPYVVAELDFESAEAMREALRTDAGVAMAADVGTFATGGTTMSRFDVDDVSPAR